MSDTQLIKLEELADKTKINPKKLRNLTLRGEIPAYRPTRDIILYDLNEVFEALKSKPFKKWKRTTKPKVKKD